MPAETTRTAPEWTVSAKAVPLLVAALALLRVCHLHLLWADEDYHLAAALNILHGKIPYRDFWYDKPPLSAFYYLLIGAHPGLLLRLLDAGYVMLACFLIYRLASTWWSKREGQTAALLLAFYLTFYLPSAAIAFAADALMIVPHLAAISFALLKRPLAAGICCAIAFLANVKAVFILAVCAAWLASDVLPLLLGAILPLLAAVAVGWFFGSLPGYWEQVWHWGWIYAAGSPVTHPLRLGAVRALDWLGFHSAIAVGAAFALLRSPLRERMRLGSWILLSFAAVCLGTRFAPHYFLQLLPPVVTAGARGLVIGWDHRPKLTVLLAGAALLVPLVRFGPRYALLASDNFHNRAPHWTDVVLDEDSQRAADLIRTDARPGETLFVWGYRPDIYVYARLTSDGKFWDSQPLTGVPADRHLQAKDPIYGGPAAQNRLRFAQSQPTWFVDGLGLLNPRLAPAAFPDLHPWLAHYRLAGRTGLSLIYRRVF